MRDIIFEYLKEDITLICGEKSRNGYKYRLLEDMRNNLKSVD